MHAILRNFTVPGRFLAGLSAVLVLASCASNQSGDRLRQDALNDKDMRIELITLDRALETQPSGETLSWSNPDSSTSGSIQPLRTWLAADGVTYCREYRRIYTVENQSQDQVAVACRRNGIWISVKNS